MSETTINVVKDFSDTPGGRHRVRSEKSGEEFREDVLRPAMAKADIVHVEMNGASGYPHSFLDESFGKIIDEIGVAEFERRIQIHLADNPIASRRLAAVVQQHSIRK